MQRIRIRCSPQRQSDKHGTGADWVVPGVLAGSIIQYRRARALGPQSLAGATLGSTLANPAEDCAHYLAVRGHSGERRQDAVPSVRKTRWRELRHPGVAG